MVSSKRHDSGVNHWMITSGVLAVLLIISVFTNGFRFGSGLTTAITDIEKAASKTENLELKESLVSMASELRTAEAELKKVAPVEASEGEQPESDSPAYNGEKVTFEMYVMSQCPFGTQVVDAMAPVKKQLGDALDLKIDYILYPKSQYAGSEEQFCVGDLCAMHGVPEVMGNIAQLCAMKYNPDTYLDMIVCMNKNVNAIPGNWEQCAKDAKLNVEAIKTCYEGNEGKELQRLSAQRAENKGATGSPTMFVGAEPYRGARTADNFLREICYRFTTKPEACKSIPEPIKFDMVILNDKNCKSCDPSQITAVSKQLFPGAQVRIVDVSSDEGKRLIQEHEVILAPAYFFDEKVTETESWKERPELATAFDKKGRYYKLQDSQTGASYVIDPAVRSQLTQAKGITLGDNKPQIDFFVMSYCPYGNTAEEAIYEAYKILGDKVEWKPHYVLYSNYGGGGPNYCLDEENVYCSMHGIQELNQNIRETCVLKGYGIENWFKFAIAMNEKCTSMNADTCWQAVADSLRLDPAKISACEKDEGLAMAKKDLEMSRLFGAQGSPAVYVDGEMFNGARSPAGYQQAVCAAFTTAPKECDIEASTATANLPAGSC